MLLRREERKGALKRWFWMIILATAELYGGTPIPSLMTVMHPLSNFVMPIHREL